MLTDHEIAMAACRYIAASVGRTEAQTGLILSDDPEIWYGYFRAGNTGILPEESPDGW